jgi:hypothetical protein
MGPRGLAEAPGLTPMPPDALYYIKPGHANQTRRGNDRVGAKSLVYLIARGPVMAGLLDKGRPTADDAPP